MSKRKPFSILKWLVFPTLSLALAAIVAWFNIRAFGWQDGAIYLGVVTVITAFSIAINKYVKLIDDDDPSNDHLAITAFVFEIILTLALAINAAYSLSVQREMSIARQTENHQSEDLKTVSKLKDRRAQREAARMLREQSKGAKTSQSIFAENERVLFWIMAGEMLAYIIAAFTLYAVSQLIRRKPKAATRTAEEFPSEIETDMVDDRRNTPRFQRPKSRANERQSLTVAISGDRKTELKKLREHLKAIAFYHPGNWFKADLIRGGVTIRLFKRDNGHEIMVATTDQSDKLLAAVDRPDFRDRLLAELTHQGFPLNKAD